MQNYEVNEQRSYIIIYKYYIIYISPEGYFLYFAGNLLISRDPFFFITEATINLADDKELMDLMVKAGS